MRKRFDIDPAKIDLGRFARTYNRLAQQDQERAGMVFPAPPVTSAEAPTQRAVPEASGREDTATAHRTLLARANTETPDAATLAELRAFFDVAPDAWQAIGDLAQIAEREVLAAIAPTALRRDAVARVAAALRADMGYAEAPAIERALIDHAVLCWLRLHRAEINYTRILAESVPLTTADYWERRLSAAQRRYLRAVETLARVRRLLRPTAPPVQVNIAAAGGQQVNQLQPAGSPGPHGA